MILTLMSGYSRRNFASFGQRDRVGRRVGSRDPNGAGGLLPELTQRRELGLDLLEPQAHGVEQAIARLGRRDAARGAGQEPKPEPFLEATNGMAEGGLRNAQLRGGFGEAALAPDGQEGQEVVQICALH